MCLFDTPKDINLLQTRSFRYVIFPRCDLLKCSPQLHVTTTAQKPTALVRQECENIHNICMQKLFASFRMQVVAPSHVHSRPMCLQMKNDKDARSGRENLIDLCTLDGARRLCKSSEWQLGRSTHLLGTTLCVNDASRHNAANCIGYGEKELFFIRVIKFTYS